MHLSPKKAGFIVVAIVVTGEAIAEGLAKHASLTMGLILAIFAGILIYSIKTSKRRN